MSVVRPARSRSSDSSRRSRGRSRGHRSRASSSRFWRPAAGTTGRRRPCVGGTARGAGAPSWPPDGTCSSSICTARCTDTSNPDAWGRGRRARSSRRRRRAPARWRGPPSPGDTAPGHTAPGDTAPGAHRRPGHRGAGRHRAVRGRRHRGRAALGHGQRRGRRRRRCGRSGCTGIPGGRGVGRDGAGRDGRPVASRWPGAARRRGRRTPTAGRRAATEGGRSPACRSVLRRRDGGADRRGGWTRGGRRRRSGPCRSRREPADRRRRGGRRRGHGALVDRAAERQRPRRSGRARSVEGAGFGGRPAGGAVAVSGEVETGRGVGMGGSARGRPRRRHPGVDVGVGAAGDHQRVSVAGLVERCGTAAVGLPAGTGQRSAGRERGAEGRLVDGIAGTGSRLGMQGRCGRVAGCRGRRRAWCAGGGGGAEGVRHGGVHGRRPRHDDRRRRHRPGTGTGRGERRLGIRTGRGRTDRPGPFRDPGSGRRRRRKADGGGGGCGSGEVPSADERLTEPDGAVGAALHDGQRRRAVVGLGRGGALHLGRLDGSDRPGAGWRSDERRRGGREVWRRDIRLDGRRAGAVRGDAAGRDRAVVDGGCRGRDHVEVALHGGQRRPGCRGETAHRVGRGPGDGDRCRPRLGRRGPRPCSRGPGLPRGVGRAGLGVHDVQGLALHRSIDRGVVVGHRPDEAARPVGAHLVAQRGEELR